jgi:error-prone DNA polymerase
MDGPRYAEFAVASNFSFLRGASHPDELVGRAVGLSLAGLGLADRNSVAGVVRAHAASREAGTRLRFHPGARLVFRDGTPDILAFPVDRAGWGRLTRLLTTGNRRAEKGACLIDLNDLAGHLDGLSLIVMPGSTAEAPASPADPATVLRRLADAAPGRVRLAGLMRYHGRDRALLAARADLAKAAGIPLIAVNDVVMHAPERRPVLDTLTCIRQGVTLERAGRRLAVNAERHLKDGATMARLFRDHPDAIAETVRVSESLTFNLDELRYEYPDEVREGFADAQSALIHATREGARLRYPAGVPAKVEQAIAHELALIADLAYAPYFLTVHDIVRFARSQGILCQGRGSAANSAVCFCLGITEVDPDRSDLLFERFVSAERREPPDIDVDFEHERREEVIQYVYRRYGRERAGLAATVIYYRGRSTLREVAKVFGLSEDTINALTGNMWGSWGSLTEIDLKRAGLADDAPRVKAMLAVAGEVLNFPRHLSQHVGGFVITRGRLDELVPIQNAAMEDRTVVEWDKDDLDALGILKVDLLGLGMLSCLRRALHLLDAHYGERLTLASIPAEDPRTYAMIQRADTLGVFQIESRAQMTMLPRLKPATFYDLVIEVAIVRPGPIQGDMVHPYLRRRQGKETVAFPSPSPDHGPPDELARVLGKTLGVPLFQEQAMKIAIVAAGFTPSEADRLRRAMATFRKVGTIGTFARKMVDGMVARGYDRAFAERCFKQIEGFGEYGFPESHAASFALLVYASCWLKCHYPDVFACALLNSQPMGFYAPAQIVRDLREHGVAVRPVDVNRSHRDSTLEPGPAAAPRLNRLHADMAGDVRSTHALRLGFREVKGLSDTDMDRIVARRGAGYDSVRDLWLRTGLSVGVLERLAEADAFAGLGLARREALWAVKALGRTGDADDLPLFAASLAGAPQREPDVSLPPMPPGAEVVMDYRFLRLTLRDHPAAFLRADLERRRIGPNGRLRDLPDGARASASGLVTVRQRPGSAKGVVFMTIEDETGIANVIVWPALFERFRPVVLGARYVAVGGVVRNETGVIHLVADRLADLTPLLGRLAEDGAAPEALARADEVKRPVDDQRAMAAERRKALAARRLAAEVPEVAAEMGMVPALAADLDVPARATRHVPARRRGVG